jgi:hypothetical protein
MKKTSQQLRQRCTIILLLVCCTKGHAQAGADSRVCNCFVNAVPADFMLGSKALYGRIGIMLERGMQIKPQQSQAVKFVIPEIKSKPGCNSSYSIYITDEAGKKVYEAAGAGNEITYRFSECNKTYNILLMAYSSSAKGGDGNCTRRIAITAKPQCNTVACNCFADNKGKAGTTGDLNINGKVECLSPSGTQRRYVLRFDIVNKSACILNIQTITVHGQTVEVPAYNTAPQSTTQGISLALSTPLSQAPPSDTRLSMIVRYLLNDKKCVINMEIPYADCR